MKAVTWQGRYDVEVQEVPDPILLNPRDAIVRVTSTAICGSDLHLYDGYIPSMKKGDILGHEFMGEVVQVGDEVHNIKIDDRVIVPFVIACGSCYYCQNGMSSLCDNSNPNAWSAEAMYGFSSAGFYGYSHMFGGYAGGQAEYVRVPYADFDCFKVNDGLTDEQVLFLTDIFPTGYQAVDTAGVKAGDVVAVWGAGPVGQFVIRSAYLCGAEKVIAVDRIPERLRMAHAGGADVLNYEGSDVVEALKEMTGGRGPDICIDAVGMEAQHGGIIGIYDKVKQEVRMETDRPHALREAIQACAKGGTVSFPGVYSAFLDKFNFGAAFGKGLKFVMGQTHVHRYLPMLLDFIREGKIDPSFVITHKLALEDAPEAYRIFQKKEDGCIKVVLKP
jgi:threonine dehydrogenase-like Zn-dependent dehydrogenase